MKLSKILLVIFSLFIFLGCEANSANSSQLSEQSKIKKKWIDYTYNYTKQFTKNTGADFKKTLYYLGVTHSPKNNDEKLEEEDIKIIKTYTNTNEIIYILYLINNLTKNFQISFEDEESMKKQIHQWVSMSASGARWKSLKTLFSHIEY